MGPAPRMAHYASLAEQAVFITGAGSGMGAAHLNTSARQSGHVARVELVEAPAAIRFSAPLSRPNHMTAIAALQQGMGAMAAYHGATCTAQAFEFIVGAGWVSSAVTMACIDFPCAPSDGRARLNEAGM